MLQEAAAADPGSLPLLEFVLDALYEAGPRAPASHLRSRIVRLEASKARSRVAPMRSSRRFPPDIQEALPALLRALTTVRPGDEKVTARPVALSEIAATPARRALVDALIAARLLISDEDVAGNVFVRLAHEALLSRWPRAREIVSANRNFLETRARLRADAERWHSDNKNRELLLPSGKRLAEGQELLLSRRAEVDGQVIDYIEASSRAQKEEGGAGVQAERALIEAAEAAKRQRLEREADRLAGEAERRNLAAAAAIKLARRTRYAAVVAAVLALVAGLGAFVGFEGQQEARQHAALAQMNADKAKSAESEALEARDQALRARLAAEATAREAKGRQLGVEAVGIERDLQGVESAERAAALSIEGWRRFPTAAAFQAAAIALRELPRYQNRARGDLLATASDGSRAADPHRRRQRGRPHRARRRGQRRRLQPGRAICSPPRSDDGSARLIRTADGSEVARIEHGDSVRLSPSARRRPARHRQR